MPGLKIKILSLRDEYTAEDLPAWNPLPVTVSDILGPRRFGFAPRLYPELVVAGLDILHVHGIWQYPSLATLFWSRRTRQPYLISTHGMLDPWAVSHARWKKRLVYGLYEGLHLRGAACLHALCDAEARAMRDFGLRNPICVIPNGIALPDAGVTGEPAWRSSLPPDAQVLFYLGRLHPKKNLARLVDAWAVTPRRQGRRDDWHLVIAGWDEGGYEATLKAQVKARGLGPRVHFVGPLFERAKAEALRCVDAFVLPSLSEGLPMVVLEAWAYGLPVLMTDACNLPEGFQDEAAIRLPLDPDGMAATLADVMALDPQTLSAMGARGRRLVERRFTWGRIGGDMAEVYRWVLGGGPPPATVVTD
ncbi:MULTISPECIES: glycosyltransferase [unclassified Thiocapsa]|uniref:glycosyltransferase n=1 Tax=unclassified Thiocapsa TaxID=2641286 RepID=UPI0035B192F1